MATVNKLSQTEWLKITDIYSLVGLEARSPHSVSLGWKQGVGRAMLPPEALGGNPLLASCSFRRLQASISLSSPPPSLHHLLAHVFHLSLSGSYETHVIAFRTQIIQESHFKILNLIVSAKILFPNKVIFTGSGDYDLISQGGVGGALRSLLHLKKNCCLSEIQI